MDSQADRWTNYAGQSKCQKQATRQCKVCTPWLRGLTAGYLPLFRHLLA